MQIEKLWKIYTEKLKESSRDQKLLKFSFESFISFNIWLLFTVNRK